MSNTLEKIKESAQVKILCELIKKSGSSREFGRLIQEDPIDIHRWKTGKKPLTARAIIAICRAYPQFKPCYLNPDLFPDDLEFVFRRGSL